MTDVGGPYGQGSRPVKPDVEGPSPSPTATKRSRKEQLGMDYGTACGRLRKMVLHHVLVQAGINECFRCKRLIETAEELSLDHKLSWLHVSAELFWDLDNVAFSHLRCNTIDRPNRREPPSPEVAWCSDHKAWLPRSGFGPGKRWDGTHPICRSCQAKRQKRRDGENPRFPCPQCGYRIRKTCSQCGWDMPMKDYMKLRRLEGATY